MRKRGAVAYLLALIGTSAAACEIDPPSGWLPGYTAEQRAARSDEILKAERLILAYERIEKGTNEAEAVYLGRVLASQDLARNVLEYHATIQPLKEIKGAMPKSRQLVSPFPSFCGRFTGGDGDATFGKKGDLVVVFEGLPKDADSPRGIHSVRMSQVFYGPILDAVDNWMFSQPDYGPSP